MLLLSVLILCLSNVASTINSNTHITINSTSSAIRHPRRATLQCSGAQGENEGARTHRELGAGRSRRVLRPVYRVHVQPFVRVFQVRTGSKNQHGFKKKCPNTLLGTSLLLYNCSTK